MSEDHDHQPRFLPGPRYIFTPGYIIDQTCFSSSLPHCARTYTSPPPIFYAALTKHIELLAFYPKEALVVPWSRVVLAFCPLLLSPPFCQLGSGSPRQCISPRGNLQWDILTFANNLILCFPTFKKATRGQRELSGFQILTGNPSRAECVLETKFPRYKKFKNWELEIRVRMCACLTMDKGLRVVSGAARWVADTRRLCVN